jgi:hypothetical protein
MSDPNAQMNAQLQVAQIESAQMAGAPSGVFPGGMPHVMVPGQPVTTAQMAAAAAATKHPQDMTLAQIAAAQNASDPGKKPAKAKKTYQTKAMKAAAAANEANPASHTTSAVPAAAPGYDQARVRGEPFRRGAARRGVRASLVSDPVPARRRGGDRAVAHQPR